MLTFLSGPQMGSGDFVFTPVHWTVSFQPGTTYWLVAEPDPNSLGTFEWRGTSPPTLPTGGSVSSAGYLLNGQPDQVYNRFAVSYGCYANCDRSTTPPILNVADFACFMQRFFAQEPYANCDSPNFCNPVCFNVADFSCFLGKFAAGCP